jgi:superfamily II DNA or RNA helicase
VNVDLFGEGFDLPAIEVVSMARPTASYALYSQQFGRALRLLDSKTHAFVIDHVGNALRHGLPDAPREWSLDRRERRSSSKEDPDTVKLRSCLECFGVYERLLKVCPYCGAVHVPAQRAHPEHVDGDLTELDPETLARLRGDADRFHLSPHAVAAEAANRYVPKLGQLAAANRHRAWQEAQRELRDSIAVWAGWQRAAGRDDSESYRRFYLSYGVDVLTAQGLGVDEAKNLKNRIDEQVNGFRVRGA